MSTAATSTSSKAAAADQSTSLNLERAIEKLVVTERLLHNGEDCSNSTASALDVADAVVEDKNNAAVDVDDNEGDGDADGDVILPSSDLSDRNRRIWIVTTAGLPWMTGTAVNPLLRALSLCQDRPAQYVTLMIPWLVSYSERKVLYGNKHDFLTQQDQEAWIRQYCIERCNCTHEVAYQLLNIRFWLGKYHESFGSIFPIEDICSTIPRDEADICILEEPEHLNWFRVPAVNSSSTNNTKKITGVKANSPRHSQQEEKKQESNIIMEAENPFEIETGSTITPLPLEVLDGTTTSTVVISTAATGAEVPSTVIRDEDIEVLGWAHKFKHVVGILHTNYADYIRQYGMASMVTAPALNALSSLVVKAYCHKVIRLSETLPPLDITKEVTCNVHGVRHEFLELPTPVTEEVIETDETEVPVATDEVISDSVDCGSDDAVNDLADVDKIEIAPVYFIGKLIWAKGFERVLELQERYKMITNEYFPIDIYGGGKDEKEIQIAFFGRNGSHRGSSSSLHESSASNQQLSDMTAVDGKAAAVFGAGVSLRDQICGEPTPSSVVDDDYVLVDSTYSGESRTRNSINGNEESTAGGIASVSPGTPPDAATSIKKLLVTPNVDDDAFNVVIVDPPSAHNNNEDGGMDTGIADSSASPIEVLGDLSGKTITTTVDTADATMKLIDSAMKAGLNILSGGNNNAKKRSEAATESSLSPKNNANNTQPNPFQNIAPAKTRFKWRRNPVPARFLGVQDHIIVRDIAEHKIFLNMSTSEVLCTTSAEALAMGKFVILPRHCSNTFFLQFPNCLSYDSWDECLERLQFALKNEPTPLSEEHRHALSWDGATERLVKSAAITKRDFEARKAKGLDKADAKAAQFHVDAGTKSNWLRKKILT